MKINQVRYPDRDDCARLGDKLENLTRYMRLAAEYGRADGADIAREFERALDTALERFDQLARAATDPDEPDALDAIRALRPDGPRRLCAAPGADYPGRLRGAFLGRLAGCTLGAALEFESIEHARSWARRFGDAYPPLDYWSQVRNPEDIHYLKGRKRDLTRAAMSAAPPDDDIMYTLLGLLTLEQYGPDFAPADMARVWLRYLPLGPDYRDAGDMGCWWGERIMLKNLARGMELPEAGIQRNPNLQSIAAWTRADSYGYAFPGNPERAAALAWRDASANHRRNGVYGAMFMAATISAAFAVDDPLEAVRIGLTEIPRDCMFAEAVRWALSQRPRNYLDAYDLTWARYRGMFNGSAITNAVHVVMGLMLGEGDFTRTIGQTVAMSGDNDCTGATAGSILGAVIGADALPAHWTRPFNGQLHSYLNELPEYIEIEEVCARFEALAARFGAE